MGSMMADLETFKGAINAAERAHAEHESTLDELSLKLFSEVEYVWPKLGYPPLVTPFSQYVKNTALMNIFAMSQGKPRFSSIDKDTWGMIQGKMGNLPGPLAPEIIELAKEKGLEFHTENPQDNYPDELPHFRQMMKEEGWDEGQDQEELFEFAMHERQYRDYKSGAAKERFNHDLAEMKAKANAPIEIVRPVIELPKFNVEEYTRKYPKATPVQAPVKGKLLWEVSADDVSMAPTAGTEVKKGKAMGYVQTYYGQEEIVPAVDGRVVATLGKQGEDVVKGEIIAFVE